TELNLELDVHVPFEAPTVAQLARMLDGAGAARTPLTATRRPDLVPLSFWQQRLWFLSQLDGSNGTYNAPVAARLSGPLDREALQAALGDVMARHEPLRTVFPQVDGQPYQRVLPGSGPVLLPVVEVDEATLSQQIDLACSQAFDLATEVPVRARLLRMADQEHVLLLVLHHIACDGWSLTPLFHDLETAYRARRDGSAPDWKPLPVQYADYVLWQRELLGTEDSPDSELSRQLGYWEKTLAGVPEELDLPADRPRSSAAVREAGTLLVDIPQELRRGLADLARQEQATLFMTVHAALAALYTRLGAGTDIPLGTVVAGRTDDALDDLVGFFVNTLVLRTDTSGNPTFRQLLARVRDHDLAALSHQEVPFEKLVEILNPARSNARHPLFQTMLVLQNNAGAQLRLHGLESRNERVGAKVAKLDLSFSFEETTPDGGLTGVVEYAKDLFDRASVETLSGRLVRLLEAVVAEPDRRIGALDLLSDEETDLVLTGGNGVLGGV
ncbi:condensation domain-containing protein, partial [Acrocarpospora corrugata]